jgi:hypothetical protein
MMHKPVFALGILLACVASIAWAQPNSARDESVAMFKQIAEVLRHPRCMNCHTFTQFPRQGDDRHRHVQMVVRGPNNSGFPTLQCSACHQTTNVADGAVPGAPNWHLAPLSMGWEGLPDNALCRVLMDTRKNGSKSIDALVHHMTDDALVQWAWAAGGRVPPPLAQAEFHRVVRRWAETGAACPR